MIMALIAIAPAIIGLLVVAAVFSAAETGLTGASRGRMHQLERDGDRAAARVNRLIGERESMISSVFTPAAIVSVVLLDIVRLQKL